MTALPDPVERAALQQALQRADTQADLLACSELMSRSGSFELRWPDGVVSLSAGLCALLGLDGEARAAALPQALDSLAWIPVAERRLVARFWQGAVAGEPFEFQHSLLAADGRRLQVLHRGLLQPPLAEGAAPTGVALLHDITGRREAEQRLQALTLRCETTGLSNRHHLLQQLDAVVRNAGWSAQGFSLLSIEVHRIAEVALTIGQAAGDAMAVALAARLRAFAGPDDRIAHLGAGEFALLSRGGAAPDVLALRAQQLRLGLQQPVACGATDIFPQCRIGIARHPGDGDDGLALLRAAQTARLDAPVSGGVAFFQPQSEARALRDLQLEAALRHALARDEFSLVYQPQVSLESGAIVGAEALLRWTSPDWGAVAPAEFVPLAERSGLIAPIGDWVLRQVCGQTVRWRQAGLPRIRIGVNISSVQFQLVDMAASIRGVLRDTGADAAALAIELTESALQQDSERLATTLRALRADGIEIALDDFGTGFSSLSRLRHLPIDLLKVDRSFVSDVTAAPESASVTRSIINLAHGLQIPVLAEGVETAGQLNMLMANGCDRIQGFLFSPPLAADALAALLQAGRRLDGHGGPQPARRRTLLLVDDEPGIVSALKRLFRRDGYRLLSAVSGPEALELLASEPVDVILSDQRMPGMTGVDFLRRTKALYPDTIRMTLSGFTDLQSIIDAVNEGAVYKFLTKPWDDDRLREHVAHAFVQKEMADDNRRLQGQVASANAEQAQLNHRLERLLQRQREQAELMQVSAGGLRELVDRLPTVVLGIDPDGLLAFINQRAADLLPACRTGLGVPPEPPIQQVLDDLRALRRGGDKIGRTVLIDGQIWRAWLRRLEPAGQPDAVGRGDLLVLLPQDDNHA